ncbi:hypothetical protein QBC42DRAFT_314328 [Cladorrhinum samala]|uniref:Rhodopsin domain-containing protein n=1 Tax=Cladorrhinum samala TaxID=585594 RepID=A0AAV9HCZ5_9PEZI|nr:hypothetical protein QBC42DRAFT_314328 [Cladorrhinum samala]
MAAVANLSGGPVLLSFSLATGTFALSTTFVRFCTRASISTGFVAADYASLVATLVALIGTVFGVIEATSSDPSRALEFSILGQPWYLMSVTLSKISICLFFMKLLGRARQWRILLSVLIVFMAAVNFAFSLTVNLQCRPLEKLWNPSVDGGCWNPSVQRDFGYFQGAFSLFTWFFLAFFPALIAQYIPKDRNPTWPFYVSSVLSFASGIFAIIRTAQTSQTSGVSVYTLHYFYLSLMAHLEQNLGLISANVLAFGPLFSRRRHHHHHHPSPNQYSSSSSSSRRSNKRPRPGANPNVPQSLSRSGSSSSSRSIATTHRTGGTSDSKRSSKFIIQGGAATDTDDPGRYFSPQRPSFDSELELDLDIDNEDVEAWPRGIIIKTVSVEVVEEVNPDHYARQAASPGQRHQRDNSTEVGGEMDWETILRAGPPR